MAIELPEVFEFEMDVDGRRVRGSYAFMLGLTVYYKGDARNARQPARAEDVLPIAQRLLAQMVRDRAAETPVPDPRLPAEVRRAAEAYLDADPFDDEEAIRRLIASLGETTPGSAAHRRVGRLLLAALSPILPAWRHMCDGEAPIAIHAALRAWFDDPSRPVDWAAAQTPVTPMHDGRPVEDCDICRARPIAQAVAACAAFLYTGEQAAAVTALAQASLAASEGCWPAEEKRSFEQWLIAEALGAVVVE